MTAQPKERDRPYKIAEDTDAIDAMETEAKETDAMDVKETDATVAKETEATDAKETDVNKAGTDIHTTPPVASNGLHAPPPSARR